MSRMEATEEMSPRWLRPMLQASYFVPCLSHGVSTRIECNMFCLDCLGDAFCSHCLVHHKDHQVLQVYQYKLLPRNFIRKFIYFNYFVIFLNRNVRVWNADKEILVP